MKHKFELNTAQQRGRGCGGGTPPPSAKAYAKRRKIIVDRLRLTRKNDGGLVAEGRGTSPKRMGPKHCLEWKSQPVVNYFLE